MATQVNWQKIRTEINRLTDVESLKSEVQRIGNEIRKFDYHTVLSPNANQKIKTFEKRYNNLMRSIAVAQRQADREFNKILRQIKVRRADLNKIVTAQRSKLEKASGTLRKRFAKKTKTAGRKRTAAKAGVRRRAKKV